MTRHTRCRTPATTERQALKEKPFRKSRRQAAFRFLAARCTSRAAQFELEFNLLNLNLMAPPWAAPIL
jgi:hypothetical protein